MKWFKRILAKRTPAEEHAAAAVIDLVERRGMTTETAEAMVADLLDALIVLPEPFDTMSDAGISRIVHAVAEALKRDPDEMRARALKLHDKGHHRRGDNLIDRAAALELRR